MFFFVFFSGRSYMIAWIGVGFSLIASILFSCAAICLRREREKEEAVNMQYLMPGKRNETKQNWNSTPHSISRFERGGEGGEQEKVLFTPQWLLAVTIHDDTNTHILWYIPRNKQQNENFDGRSLVSCLVKSWLLPSTRRNAAAAFARGLLNKTRLVWDHRILN